MPHQKVSHGESIKAAALLKRAKWEQKGGWKDPGYGTEYPIKFVDNGTYYRHLSHILGVRDYDKRRAILGQVKEAATERLGGVPRAVSPTQNHFRDCDKRRAMLGEVKEAAMERIGGGPRAICWIQNHHRCQSHDLLCSIRKASIKQRTPDEQIYQGIEAASRDPLNEDITFDKYEKPTMLLDDDFSGMSETQSDVILCHVMKLNNAVQGLCQQIQKMRSEMQELASSYADLQQEKQETTTWIFADKEPQNGERVQIESKQNAFDDAGDAEWVDLN